MQTVTEGVKRWHNGSLLRNIIAQDFSYATYLLAMAYITTDQNDATNKTASH
jgi:hypothetical protein